MPDVTASEYLPMKSCADALPTLISLSRMPVSTDTPFLAIAILGALEGEEVTHALFELCATADERLATVALSELRDRLDASHVGRVLALLERRAEPAMRSRLFELVARLGSCVEHLKAMAEPHPATDPEEAMWSWLARCCCGDDEAVDPTSAALADADPSDLAEPIELLGECFGEPSARVLVELLDNLSAVDDPLPEGFVDPDDEPPVRVCDLAARSVSRALEGAAELRTYDADERSALRARILEELTPETPGSP